MYNVLPKYMFSMYNVEYASSYICRVSMETNIAEFPQSS